MNEQELMKSFIDDLLQEVIVTSDNKESGEFRINEFTRLASEYIIGAGEIDDIHVCYYKSRGMMVNGYNFSQDENCLDLFVTIFNQQNPPVSITKTQAETAFRQAEGVLKKALTRYHTSIEESTEAYDMFQRIHELRTQLTHVRIYLLTDGIVNAENIIADSIENISITFHVWDIHRIYRFASSGRRMETIEIDFEQEFGITIPCLSMVDPDSDYQGYLAVIPGKVLAEMYEKYGPRLLEHNVRSFLQIRGNVNKGIRKTILEEPHRFFAYNNGISATADEIEFADNPFGKINIRKVRNLQIVNGGQTTASLYHTAKKDKAALKNIFVQAKLSVIPSDQFDEIVPLISRYANSQNKVSDADFYANDPFHISIEELSRTTWAPAVDGTNKQTQWFYERARGQYLDAKAREGTPARKRQFETRYPNTQKFTKTDLAKYENTWMQLPYQVSLGAQKNFNHFSIWLKEKEKIEVNSKYFEHLLARAILFKQTERIIASLNYGGYRANIVTYTLAWLSRHTSQRIDFDEIWKKQNISEGLQEAIKVISVKVHRVITNPPNARNITEWCKRKECWETICDEKITLNQAFQQELLRHGQYTTNKLVNDTAGTEVGSFKELTLLSEISVQTWFSLAKWAKETNNLNAQQRILAASVGNTLSHGHPLNLKQMDQGWKILELAKSLGFNPEENKKTSWNPFHTETETHDLKKEFSNHLLNNITDEKVIDEVKNNKYPVIQNCVDISRDAMLEAMKTILLLNGKMSRSDAIRTAAKFLKENGAINFERLREDGPIWKGLKSTINSGLRRNVLEGNINHIWVK